MKNSFELNNGVRIPVIGFGTWRMPEGEEAVSAVKCAIELGYRHIDTAAIYKNEVSVGKAVAESGLKREELFVTSKVWSSDRGYETTLRAFEKSLNNLEMDYLDLYLVHWPASSRKFNDWEKINSETWRAMEDLYRKGKIKAIGVSNFMPHHLRPLIGSAEIKPMVNQIEFHPGQMQAETVDFCRIHGIVIEAWAPLGAGRMLANQQLIEIAAKYDKSAAQLCLRWCLQNDTLPLPKSGNPERIQANLDVFDFEISAEDMVVINAMENFGGSGLDPDKVEF